jgi:hypothetical protein
MGLLQVFESDALPYWGAAGTMQWYSLYSLTSRPDGVPLPQAFAWGATRPVSGAPDGQPVIEVFGVMRITSSPYYSWGHWIVDAGSGEVLGRRDYLQDGGIITVHSLTVDPSSRFGDPGYVYRFSYTSGHPEIYALNLSGMDSGYHGDPVLPDPATYYQISTWGLSGSPGDFAIDRGNDRVFLRDTSAANYGKVSIYRKSSPYTWIADITAPNPTQQIMPTGDGRVFLIDSYGFFLEYEIDGTPRGWSRHEAAVSSGGVSYSWDGRYSRILELRITADDAGDSTVRVRGYLPVSQPSRLIVPIPRQHPRRGRPGVAVAQLCGAGGEPIASRLATTTASVALGLVADTHLSDRGGDLLFPFDPSAAGAADAEISVPVRTQIARASDGLELPQATVDVWSTAGLTSPVTIWTAGGPQIVSFTGTTDTQLTGCSGGAGTMQARDEVTG